MPIRQVRDRLLMQPKGDRAFVELLPLAREAGVEPLQVACELSLEAGTVTGAIVMNELRRLLAPSQSAILSLPDSLRLHSEPTADCAEVLMSCIDRIAQLKSLQLYGMAAAWGELHAGKPR